ncbi:MAG TPA: GNAT family N-acetyltransferase [Ktedonobacterales bacterium]|jgi:RimJ/RimL family protein N-acetyltransferase
MIAVESARLTIREAEAEDLPGLLAVYQSNPELMAHQEGARGEAGYIDLEMFQRDWWVARMMPGRHMLGLFRTADGAAVGTADYIEEHPEQGVPWLGALVIARAQQRQGLGSEAFTALATAFRERHHWPALRIGVGSWNSGALAFWERLGFQRVNLRPEIADMVVLERAL